MRWHVVAPLREAPEYRALSRSRQEVLWFLWRRADDDGVVRTQICVRLIAERLGLPRETVRKCLQYLDRQHVIVRRPGSGRARSLYVVPVAWDLPLTDPDAEPPTTAPSASSAGTPSSGTAPGTAAGTGATPNPRARARSAAPTSTSSPSRPEWIPRRPAVQQPAIPGPRPASAGELDEEPDLWCARARAEGARHLNSRCCGTTKRQIEIRRKAAAAAAARAEQLQRAAAESAERERRLRVDEQGRVPTIDRGLAAVRAELHKPKGSTPARGEPP